MESPLLRYHSVSLDQISNTRRKSLLHFKHKSLFFSGYCFSFSKRKWRNPFDRIRCCSLEQGRLQPPWGLKPKPKPSKMDVVERKGAVLEEPQMRKQPSSGICSQIEKLVFNKRYREALELFEILEFEGGFELESSTYDALISACIGLNSIRGVKRVSSFMSSNGFELDLYMRNRVLLMHVKCGMMTDARRLFVEMPEKNLVSWNTIIGGLVDSGNYDEAFQLFFITWEESSDGGSRIFSTMIRASAGQGLIFAGRQFHTCALKMGVADDIFVTCALIDMYSKCGSIEDAQCVFDEMPEKTTVGWNSIIAGYALHGYSEEALRMFYEMRDSGVEMDHFTFSMVIRICTRLASLEHAKQAHASLVRHGFGLDTVANTALVDFYSKWGRMEDARHVFDKMPQKNVISWNALIAGYGNHGHGEEAIEMFEQMLREKMRPNHITFLAILSACSYSGLSERGWEYFKSMSRDHKIKPRAMHFACMIELLGQEGLLDEAFALIRSAPFKPTANMWAALLTACRVHENLELGKFAAEKLYGMEPEKLNNYIVLLNIYNSSGNLKEAAAVVQTLRRKGLRMLPACSWIEVKKQPYFFHSGDKSHAQTKEIYQKVDNLMLEISKHGYVPERKYLLPDVDEQEKRVLLYHSEKLAIAFGLINTPGWTPLQIVQSHRICGDCHSAIKLIAMVTRREIVVRDASRFHHFRDGSCSCGDYW
ncbi:pentatricopeptide repeat-containing protein At5g50390, chloroplastic-like [Castanea sativa]|uniref:pentatricopeptide repeat-containing protein At5g50390, chloroplastic-like n=1 Tax=Castanea sativa TaxID=21020 RepID=UPI003F64E752